MTTFSPLKSLVFIIALVTTALNASEINHNAPYAFTNPEIVDEEREFVSSRIISHLNADTQERLKVRSDIIQFYKEKYNIPDVTQKHNISRDEKQLRNQKIKKAIIHCMVIARNDPKINQSIRTTKQISEFCPMMEFLFDRQESEIKNLR